MKSVVFVLTLACLTLPAAALADDARSGLHVTVNLGGAWHQVTSSVDGLDGDTELSGAGIGGLVAVGWSVAPGLVLGLGGGGGHIFKPAVTFGGQETESENDLIFLNSGLYADYSLDPTAKGLHFQALVGLATLEEGNDDIEDIAIGFGATLGVGYRWPVSDAWSLGAVGRVQILSTTSELMGGAEVSNLSVVPAGLFSVTWH